MSRSSRRSLAEGAAFQIVFTALAIGTLEAWARFCEARRQGDRVPAWRR
jgi:hypothetical protein